MSKWKVSPLIFAVSILTFLLPFITVSCGGQKVVSLTGVQLATGMTMEQPQMFGPPKREKVDPEPTVMIAAIAGIVALVFGLLGARAVKAGVVAGGISVASLLATKIRLDDQIAKQGQGLLQVSYEMGFSLTLLLLICGTAWSGYLLGTNKSQEEQTAVPQQVPIARAAPEPINSPSQAFCEYCGTRWTSGATFCTKCGKPAEVQSASAHT
jgi:hypothetical protein